MIPRKKDFENHSKFDFYDSTTLLGPLDQVLTIKNVTGL